MSKKSEREHQTAAYLNTLLDQAMAGDMKGVLFSAKKIRLMTLEDLMSGFKNKADKAYFTLEKEYTQLKKETGD